MSKEKVIKLHDLISALIEEEGKEAFIGAEDNFTLGKPYIVDLFHHPHRYRIVVTREERDET